MIFFSFSGRTVIWSARWPTTTPQLWLHRLSQVNCLEIEETLKNRKRKSCRSWSISHSYLRALVKRRVQLFQKVHPLHNSWSNENLQCKCQYMAKGWFSRFWQHWKSWQCKEKDDFDYQTKNILISCFRNINSHIICSKWKATTRMIWEFCTPTYFFLFFISTSSNTYNW